jgi:DNA-binding CsgD family transcriptional regulator
MTGARLPLSSAQLSGLLLSIGAAAPHQTDFARVQGMCNSYLAAGSASISLCNGNDGKVHFFDIVPSAPAFRDLYQQRYWQDDPLKSAVVLAAPRRFWTRDQLLSREVCETNPYLTEVCAPAHCADVCIARIPLPAGYYCLWAFSRTIDQPRFSRLELDFLDMLLPHVEQAFLRLGQIERLSVFADVAQERLRQSGHGLIVVDQDGTPRHVNRVASTLIADGSPLTILDGKLRLQDARLAPRFDELVRRCGSTALSSSIMAAGSLAVPRSGAQPFIIGVMPFGRQQVQAYWRGMGRAVVTLFDPARQHIDTRATLREMYRLSDAEAEICWRLANGETLEKIATDTSTTRETLRSQLKRVFAKTGTKRQSELVRSVLLAPAVWARLP